MSPATTKRSDWYRERQRDIDALLVQDDLSRAERIQILILSGMLAGLIEHAGDTEALRADIAEIKDRLARADTIVSRGDVLKLLGAATLASVVTVATGAAEWLRRSIMGG